MCRVKWVILWSLWAARLVRQPTSPVKVTSGWLRGSVAPAGTHAEYVGVPYATVLNRFQAPGPEPRWDEVFEATRSNIVCSQKNPGSNEPIGQENCLVMNIYTPLNIPLNKPLPVMVFIHGGGFIQRSASPSLYGPEFLTSKGVILVTFNYRLHVQGFLCLGIKEAQGNAGMKDQVAALKWVQKNIRAFGGDPGDVTLFGESAGAASVSYHLLSPMSTGLFHKAILQSGSSLSSWALQYEPLYKASLLAKSLGFDSEDPYQLYNFFKSKSKEELTKNLPREKGSLKLSEYVFVPCIEKNTFEEPFLTELPYDLLSKGNYNKVPIIIGANSAEGLLFAGSDNKDLLFKVDILKSLPTNLDFPTEEIGKEIVAKVIQLYMNSGKYETNIAKIHGEPYFNYPVLEEARLLLDTSDQAIYYYSFEFDGWRNILKLMLTSTFRNYPGATHGDELFYLFSPVLMPSFIETEMTTIMTTMWTNFAKYGDPTPVINNLLKVRWPSLKPERQQVMIIDKELAVSPIRSSPSIEFWTEVFAKYRKQKYIS